MSETLKLEYERNGDTIEVLARGTESDVRAALARLLGEAHLVVPEALGEGLPRLWREYDGDHEAEPEPERDGWVDGTEGVSFLYDNGQIVATLTAMRGKSGKWVATDVNKSWQFQFSASDDFLAKVAVQEHLDKSTAPKPETVEQEGGA